MTLNHRSPARPRVVCIPVCGVAEIALLSVTLPSVLSNTSAGTEIVLLAVGVDAAHLQQALLQPTLIKVVQATDNADPWSALLQELPARYARHDVLLLRPGIAVPRCWDARLALAAYRQSGIAAVVPLCDSASFIALLEPNQPDQINLEYIDRLLMAHSPRRNHQIPALFSGCCYLRRAALHVLGPLITAQSTLVAGEWPHWLAQAFQEQGWRMVCCDHVYVLDQTPKHRRREMVAIKALEDVRLIEQAHPLTGLRCAIRERLDPGVTASPVTSTSLPVQLHIAHSWGGGLDYWIQQYCQNDKVRDNLVLRSIGTWGAFGQRIALYRSAVMDQPLRSWDLDYPIRATAPTHLQYQAILEAIINEFRVEVILISSLIGHALDALTTGLPTIFVAHDYYPFCPAIVIYFGEVCEHCEPQRLECCFAGNEQNRFFRNVNAAEWLSLRRRFARLASAESVRFVVPAGSVARHWQTLVPALREQQFTLIPHGLDFAPRRLPTPPAGEQLRVVVLGSLAVQKGRVLLEQICPLIAGRVHLFLIGCGEDGDVFREQAGITLIPRYRHDELADLIAGIEPEIGLLLSIWPETFSYTLSELWLLGIPVVATQLGSFADRIQDGVNGFLCPPQAEMVAERLLAIAADRTCLTLIRDGLADFHHRSVGEMVADYHALTPLPQFSAPRYFAGSTVMPDVLTANQPSRALHVDDRTPFILVLREFSQYASQKLAATPRLRHWQKRGLGILLRWGLWVAAALTRVRVRGKT